MSVRPTHRTSAHTEGRARDQRVPLKWSNVSSKKTKKLSVRRTWPHTQRPGASANSTARSERDAGTAQLSPSGRGGTEDGNRRNTRKQARQTSNASHAKALHTRGKRQEAGGSHRASPRSSSKRHGKHRAKVKIHGVDANRKTAGVARLTTHKTDFRAKKITSAKERHRVCAGGSATKRMP